MLKILIWVVSQDTRFFNSAINILERQHNGVELVGLTAIREVELFTGGKNVPNVPFIPLEKLTGGGYTIFYLSSAQKKSA